MADGASDGPVVPDGVFNADYLAFYAAELNDVTNDAEAELIETLLQLEPGERVLDLACGHGRIARRLAAAGADVVGVDSSALFLERARSDAAHHGISVDYRQADMRTIEFDREFDCVVCWFTSFGYHDDARLRDCLRRMQRALRPGGRLLIETINLHDPGLCVGEFTTAKELVDGGESQWMLDVSRYDPLDGRLHVRRMVLRSGQPTRLGCYSLRLFSPPELLDWLRAAGLDQLQAFGGEGEVFRVDSNRLIVTARRL